MLLVKLTVLVPLFVLVISAIVGFCFVLQTTPFDVIALPPLLLMAPPELAVFVVIAEIAVVVIVGNTVAGVEKLIWLP
jgi:hypothetical protein